MTYTRDTHFTLSSNLILKITKRYILFSYHTYKIYSKLATYEQNIIIPVLVNISMQQQTKVYYFAILIRHFSGGVTKSSEQTKFVKITRLVGSLTKLTSGHFTRRVVRCLIN